MHCNFRLFQVMGRDAATGEPAPMWWFGGGADLTPSYLYEEDARHFHGTLKAACDAHNSGYYARYKRWADDYFRISHRGGETRGIGGIFFDDLDDMTWVVEKGAGSQAGARALAAGSGLPAPSAPVPVGIGADAVTPAAAAAAAHAAGGPYAIFPFVVAAAESVLPAYLPILLRRKDAPFDDAQRRWLQLRRGRYVEFNLVYDR
jgi:coproporphyrinogen III oxidase